ncbi:MAG: ThuA domain-containing protein [Planctomycetes bacterium]|nr:ThuA domain-containing protein [Planctomycetota bacterium]
MSMASTGGADAPARREPRPDPWAGRRKLLAVADVQTGYHHDSISHALATIEMLGRSSGDYLANIRTDSQLITRQPILGQGAKYGGKRVNARGLGEYDAVFLLPSGEGTLTAQQKADLLAYVHDDGKGLVIGHAGILGFYDWPEFGVMAGARLGGEFMGEVMVRVEAPGQPGADAFGSLAFPFTEQHPVLKEPYDRSSVTVVMSIDPATVEPRVREKRADGDFPVVWTRAYGRGRVYHIGWGHVDSTWDDPGFQRLVLAGIRWAMGTPAA